MAITSNFFFTDSMVCIDGSSFDIKNTKILFYNFDDVDGLYSFDKIQISNDCSEFFEEAVSKNFNSEIVDLSKLIDCYNLIKDLSTSIAVDQSWIIRKSKEIINKI